MNRQVSRAAKAPSAAAVAGSGLGGVAPTALTPAVVLKK